MSQDSLQQAPEIIRAMQGVAVGHLAIAALRSRGSIDRFQRQVVNPSTALMTIAAADAYMYFPHLETLTENAIAGAMIGVAAGLVAGKSNHAKGYKLQNYMTRGMVAGAILAPAALYFMDFLK